MLTLSTNGRNGFTTVRRESGRSGQLFLTCSAPPPIHWRSQSVKRSNSRFTHCVEARSMKACGPYCVSSLTKSLLLSFVALSGLPLWAQGGRGGISGTVQDASGVHRSGRRRRSDRRGQGHDSIHHHHGRRRVLLCLAVDRALSGGSDSPGIRHGRCRTTSR